VSDNGEIFKLNARHLFNGVVDLDNVAAWNEKEFPEKAEFDRKWLASLDYLRNLCKKIRQTQPHLNKLGKAYMGNNEFPDQIVFGSVNLSYKTFNDGIPRLVPFPFEKALWLSGDKNDIALLFQLMIRLLFTLPVGQFGLYASDPKQGGKTLGPFLPLFKHKNLAADCHVLTGSEEIESMLQTQLDYVVELRQKRFMDSKTNWKTYNQQNNGNRLPYRLILLFDVPEQCTDKSLWYLTRLIELGPECGVLPVLAYITNTEKKYANLNTSLENHGIKINALFEEKVFTVPLKQVSAVEEAERELPQKLLEKLIAEVSDTYAKVADFNKPIGELWPADAFWKSRAAEGITVPIGWNNLGEEVCFAIGGANTQHHTIIGGSTGSGKSNLMHVIIHSLCHYYPPDELQIYILDYKQGTESQVYTAPPLPHAALVALESDPEYGSAVLKHLEDEKQRRADLFKNSGTVDYSQYREKGNMLPRILLIVDEFQGLFFGNKSTSENTEKYLNDLLKQGRSYGIHILLSTQALSGIQDFLSTRQLTGQIGCCIALACKPDDSARLLGNNGAANLDKERHEAIINTSEGTVQGNRIFRAPRADSAVCKEHSRKFADESLRQNFNGSTKIFNGTTLPQIPAGKLFQLPVCEEAELFPMQIGESLTYEADAFTFVFHKNAASNLLIAGADIAIHDGLLSGILTSIQITNSRTKDKIKVFYYWGMIGRKAPAFLSAYPDIRQISNIDEFDLPAITEGIKQNAETKRILIIDGLESVRKFQLETKPSDYDIKKDPTNPAYLLRDVLENGPPLGTVVIAFAENWSNCSQVCAGLLRSFEQRIGFSLGETDAGRLLSGAGSDKLSFRGVENGKNCAVFMDRLITRQELFRPYTIKPAEENN